MNLKTITSRENQRLINARKVRDGRVHDLIFIEGRRLAKEALGSDLKITECFISHEFGDTRLLDSVAKLEIDIAQLSAPLFRSIAGTDQPQGIILLAQRPDESFRMTDPLNTDVPVFIFLNKVNNPSNLGAVLRTADASGAGGVVVSGNSADVYSPKALRASMGSAFRIPVRVDAELSELISDARELGVNCLAVDSKAGKSYLDVDWSKPHLLVFGSEAHGLSENDIGKVGNAISIPMNEAVESLNLAVAAGIILFEARRQATGCEKFTD